MAEEDNNKNEDETEDKDRVEELKQEAQNYKEKAEEYLEGWKRARAELENFKKRQEKELEKTKKLFKVDFIKPLVSVLDDFESALNADVEGDKEEWLKGFKDIYKKFQDTLKELGVDVLQPEGEKFDPNFHEALEVVEGENDDMVVETLRAGYKIDDFVIRPAQVRVSKSNKNNNKE